MRFFGKHTGLTHRLMPVGGENTPVSLPKITVGLTMFVGVRDAPPQLSTGGLTAITNHIGHNLSGATTNGSPQPTFVLFLEYK